jgi:hypothetical protein
MRYALAVAVMAVAWADPFAFLRPTAVVTDREQRRLADGEVIVRTVRSRPREVTLLSAVKIGVDGPRLVSWYRSIAELRASAYVPEIGRFSDPPKIEDLQRLTLEPVDADELRTCRPDDCGLKLRPAEIVELQRGFAQSREAQRDAVQAAFRRVVLNRAQEYLRSGRADGPPPPVFLSVHFPSLAGPIVRYPRESPPGTESFLYWAKEKLSGKPIVSATHVTIAHTGTNPSLPIVISRQIFATHYEDGAWAVTTLAHDERGLTYLVYVNQTEVDLLDGFLGGLVRSTIERRLRNQAADLVQGVRRRMESGEPRGALAPASKD